MLPTALTTLLPDFSPWSAWRIAADGFQVLTIRCDTEFIPNAELVKVHPALPEIMRLLKRECPEEQFAIDSLSHVYALWASPVRVEDAQGQKVAISSVNGLEYTEDHVIFKGEGVVYQERFLLDTLSSCPRTILPTRATMYGVVVTRKWLEEHHSGWSERLTAGQGLDLSLNEALVFALNGGGVETARSLPHDLSVG